MENLDFISFTTHTHMFFEPQTDTAREWIAFHVPSDNLDWDGGAFVPLNEATGWRNAIREDGLSIDEAERAL